VSRLDVYLSAGAPAFLRIGGELAATADRAPIDGDTLARELGQVAPSEARGAWAERGLAVFAYGAGAGRVRVTLTRDHRGRGRPCGCCPPRRRCWPGSGSTAWPTGCATVAW
jgi:hypothetical protein